MIEDYSLALPLPQTSVTKTPATQISATQTDLADLHAPSRPAPPLPLTPQEKALFRVIYYGNAVELAALNPTVSAARDADEAATFHAFFPDPPPVPQPTGETE